MKGYAKSPTFNLREISLEDVRRLCQRFHGYKSAGGWATYAFGVFEQSTLVAAFAWQPPPLGAAKSVAPEAPSGVLSAATLTGETVITRWENWATPPGTLTQWMSNAGWRRVATGKFWRSGTPAHRWVRV